jgi:hypothetical protein
MARFSGDSPARVHHLERDPEFLIELPDRVQILTLRSGYGDTGGHLEFVSTPADP